MDHISNYLNFSLAGIDPPHDKDKELPTFSDLPLDSTPVSGISDNQGSKPEPTLSEINVTELKKRLYALKDEVGSIIRLLEITDGKLPLSPAFPSPSPSSSVSTVESQQTPFNSQTAGGEQILEGVFNGEKMVGPDGHEYAVPPNYASKSKLVEGDHMKLTITTYGKFIYKQIGPIERKRIIGVLQFDEATQLWSVVHEGKTYKILTASATFYHGKPGDHVVILVPKDAPSSWGAVENIIAS